MRRLAMLGVLAIATPAAAEEPMPVRGETIIIRDHAPGWKPPEPVKDPRIAPKYSDAAITRDAWTRAWLYLDIDERGVVQRVKILNRPGYDLEKIALDRVFATKFRPARTGQGKPEPSRIVYGVEWPSYWWMVKHTGLVTRIPESAGGVPCRGSGNPLNLDRAHPVYRDCTPPDLAKIPTETWIARPR